MSVTLTVRISEELLAKLDKLAAATDRSKSYLAAEAIESYVAHELPIVEKILESIEYSKTRPGIPHEEAMTRLKQRVHRMAVKEKAGA